MFLWFVILGSTDSRGEGVRSSLPGYIGGGEGKWKSGFFSDTCDRASPHPYVAMAIVKVFNCCAILRIMNCKKEDSWGRGVGVGRGSVIILILLGK